MNVPNPHFELINIRARLQTICEVITHFQPLTPRPPIIDSSYDALGVQSNQDAREGEDNEKVTSWLHPEPIPGLRKLKEDIGIDLGVLDKFLDQHDSKSLPPLSTNAPYVIAVWNEVLCAPPTVVDIFKTFLESPPGNTANQVGSQTSKDKKGKGGKRHPPSAKVDVVADGGRQWIRVNTIKNSRLLSEFCEMDSYLADTDSEPEDESTKTSPPQLDNSVIRMAQSLLTAANANPVLVNGMIQTPQVTLRLTRLDPNARNSKGDPVDERVAATIDLIRGLGVAVELGDHPATTVYNLEEQSLRRAQNRSTSQSALTSFDFVPTTNINLDLSVLIALISDLTHAPLPHSIEEANGRFVPPPEYREWKAKQRKMGGMSGKHTKNPNTRSGTATPVDPESSPQGASDPSPSPPWTKLTAEALETDINDLPRDLFKHARSLTNQLLQEMGKGMLQELHDRIELGVETESQRSSGARPQVAFWTTREARDRCLGIVAKIGGVYERRRAKGLFQVPSLADASTKGWDNGCEKLGLEEAEQLYWLDSRFEKNFVPLLPIRIYDDEVAVDGGQGIGVFRAQSSFSRVLEKVCVDMLSEGPVPHPRSLPNDLVSSSSPPTTDLNIGPSTTKPLDGFNPDVQIQRAKVTKANPRLTAHTVESMLKGAERGWTTLTANRTSVKTILREVRSVGWQNEDEEMSESDEDRMEKAVIWVVDPRSLAEGMSIFATRN